MFFLLTLLAGHYAQAQPKAWAEPTFESLGLYFNVAATPANCRVQYKTAGAAEYRDGHPMVYDPREK